MTKKRLSFLLVAVILVIALASTCLVGCNSKPKEANSTDVIMHVVKGAVAAVDGINFANFEVGADATMKVTNGSTVNDYTITIGGKINLTETGDKTEANILIKKGDAVVMNLYYKDTGEDSTSTVLLVLGTQGYQIKALSVSKVLKDKLSATDYTNLVDSTARMSDVNLDNIESLIGTVADMILPNTETQKKEKVSPNAKMNKKGTEAELYVSLANILDPNGDVGKLIAGLDVSSILGPLGIQLDISNILNILPSLAIKLNFTFDKADKTTKINKLTNVAATIEVGKKDVDIKTTSAGKSLLKFSIANDIKVELNSSIAFGAGASSGKLARTAASAYANINAININMGGKVVGTDADGTVTDYVLSINGNIDPTVFRDLDFADFSKSDESFNRAVAQLASGVKDLNISIKNDSKTLLAIRAQGTSSGLSLQIKAGDLTLDAWGILSTMIKGNLPDTDAEYERIKAAADAAEATRKAKVKAEADAKVAEEYAKKMFTTSGALVATKIDETTVTTLSAAIDSAAYNALEPETKTDIQTIFSNLVDENDLVNNISFEEYANAQAILDEIKDAKEWIDLNLFENGAVKYSKVDYTNYAEITNLLKTDTLRGVYQMTFDEAAKYYGQKAGAGNVSLNALCDTTLYMIGDILRDVGIEIKDGVTINFNTAMVSNLLASFNINVSSFSGIIDTILGHANLAITINSFNYGGYQDVD